MWDELQAFAGWAGLISVALVLALVERMRRVFATREDMEVESRERKTADAHIDERMVPMAQQLHNYMGKMDLLRDQMERADRDREREAAKLREEMRTGFARIEGLLERDRDEPPKRRD